MYNNILIPTDGHEYVSEALTHAANIATLTDGTIHTIYAVDTRDYSTLPETRWLELEQELRDKSDAAFEPIETYCAERDIPVVTACERGVPHEVILTYAQEHDIDMIVMATHGRTGLDHFLHGNITEKVMHHATVPVVAIHVQSEDSREKTLNV